MKRFILNIISLVIICSGSAFAASVDCLPLAGTYAAIPETYPGYDPAVLEISYNPGSVLLTYGSPADGRYRTEEYLLDGVKHIGDRLWSGNTYTAVCTSGVLSIVKDFSPEYPQIIMTATLAISADILTENLSLPGGYSRLQGLYSRVR